VRELNSLNVTYRGPQVHSVLSMAFTGCRLLLVEANVNQWFKFGFRTKNGWGV
jgi:hypothetical protein